ncbi:MAG: hypothetical protein KKF68_02270 [Nanoarchaeota archaeon]|nr:hypothetical protein [Nanoarchaeota archaeon]
MGIIKRGLLIVACVLLFISFLAGNFFSTLYLSLSYDNIQPALNESLTLLAEQTNFLSLIQEKQPFAEEHCKNYTDYVFKEDTFGYVFVIPCNLISETPGFLLEYNIEKFIHDIYYKDYSCSMWGCFKEMGTPFFMISEKFRNYWRGKFYFAMILSTILFILIFFLVEKKTNSFLIAGILLVVSTIPFVRLDFIIGLFIRPLIYLLGLSEVYNFPSSELARILYIFFTKANMVFLIFLFIGLGIILVGIILKFFAAGFKISELFSRFSKKSSLKQSK